MRSTPAPTLRCPEPGCRDRLYPVRNAKGTRFLRRGRSGGGCPHWWVGMAGATGPESQRHLWLKARLASICLQLGWAAVPEDPNTRADVWLPDARTALEVQLRRTDTLARTSARMRAGASQVVWFFGPDVAARGTLLRAPAVRFDVVSQSTGERVRPWEQPCEDARIVVFGTVWRWQDWRLVTGPMSGYRFLAALLAGQLVWCPPGTPGLPQGRGGWVRWTDLALALPRSPGPAGDRSGTVPVPASAWIEAQLRQRKARRPRRNGGQAVGRSPRSDAPGLLQPQYDPESHAEQAESEAEERRRWEDDRPPHYEAR